MRSDTTANRSGRLYPHPHPRPLAFLPCTLNDACSSGNNICNPRLQGLRSRSSKIASTPALYITYARSNPVADSKYPLTSTPPHTLAHSHVVTHLSPPAPPLSINITQPGYRAPSVTDDLATAHPLYLPCISKRQPPRHTTTCTWTPEVSIKTRCTFVSRHLFFMANHSLRV